MEWGEKKKIKEKGEIGLKNETLFRKSKALFLLLFLLFLLFYLLLFYSLFGLIHFIFIHFSMLVYFVLIGICCRGSESAENKPETDRAVIDA